ncbi:hypothetical protein ACJ73_01389 [Blastomyces percursus]|uniref:NACHT domain-containing protein n=1 Tax=Blastomyces percursus TaxID=1658174 RepID=A0A1J9QFG5_9EURO|nr:hypothetical protein ACJ73_01389 [Blastomyces percursus]
MDGDSESLTSALLTAICDENTLLLLDGFDEISGERNASGIGLAELFKDLLNTRNAIITSRPYVASPPNLLPFDLELETVECHPNQVQAEVPSSANDSYMRDFRVKMEDDCYEWSLREMKLLNDMYLCRESEFPDHLLDKMIAKESDEIRVVLLKALASRPQLSRETVDSMIILLQDDNRNGRTAASRALEGRTNLPEDVLQALIHRLKDVEQVFASKH